MSLAIVIYTNETNLPILELFLKYFYLLSFMWHIQSFKVPHYRVLRFLWRISTNNYVKSKPDKNLAVILLCTNLVHLRSYFTFLCAPEAPAKVTHSTDPLPLSRLVSAHLQVNLTRSLQATLMTDWSVSNILTWNLHGRGYVGSYRAYLDSLPKSSTWNQYPKK